MANIPRLRLWSHELRTTTERQGQVRLNPRPGKFCCLGIAELVAARHGGPATCFVREDGSRVGLPGPEHDEWYGLGGSDGLTLASLPLRFPFMGVAAVLPYEANDAYNLPFPVIADAIDRLLDEWERAALSA